MASEQGGSVGADDTSEQRVDDTPKHKDDGAPVALVFARGFLLALALGAAAGGLAWGGWKLYQAVQKRGKAPRQLAAPRRLPSPVAAQREAVPA